MLDTVISTILSVFSGIRILDVLDILIVAFAIYKVFMFIGRTRAQQLVKGLVLLLVLLVVANILDLYTIKFILSNALKYGAMAIMVIFYPEFRRALEYLGRSKFSLSGRFSSDRSGTSKQAVSEICEAVKQLAADKTGALIVIEREIALGDIAETGTKVEGDVSAMLLETIFYEGSALHDGAVIIRKDSIYAAGCVLPLTRLDKLERTLGTRHRSGIGITEVSDAVCIIVSEETGIISMASEGKLVRFLDVKTIEKKLLSIYMDDIEETSISYTFKNFFRRKKNAK